ncbi:MAG: hypothetical protein M3454_15520 [Actinomycetota bacterium]|nr:hypothetical protein [Actinomycetota bacterium]
MTKLRWAALFLLLLPACTGRGINAGEEGGLAFIALAATLVLGCAILWFILGREE